MISKSQAIVLRITPYSKSSHIVTWLTGEQGKITTIVKGAIRPKSAFLGQYDLFYTCELLYYQKERNGLHITRECSPLKIRDSFRSDWHAAACASYICDMISVVSFKGSHQPELFTFTDSVLDYISSVKIKPHFIFWFELKLLELLGLAPRFSSCIACRRELAQNSRLSFSFSHGGFLCGTCEKTNAPESGTVRIRPDIVSILRTWQESTAPRSIQNIHCIGNQLLDLNTILDKFITFHLDMKLPSRGKAFEILNIPRKQRSDT